MCPLPTPHPMLGSHNVMNRLPHFNFLLSSENSRKKKHVDFAFGASISFSFFCFWGVKIK
jgi:hypothetical protein